MMRWHAPSIESRRGVVAEEYAVLVTVLVVVAALMSHYVRDSLRGMVRWVEILCNTMGR